MDDSRRNLTKTFAAITTTIILWASAFVGIRAGLRGYSAGSLALLRYLVASFCMIFLFARLKSYQKPTLNEIPMIALLGVIGFSVYNIALNASEHTVTAGIASFIICLLPVLMTILAVFFLKERLNKIAWAGIYTSFLGVAIIAYGEREGMSFDFGVVLAIIAAASGAIYSTLQKPLLKKFHPIEMSAYCIWAGTLGMSFYAPTLWYEIPKAPLNATLAAIYMGIFPATIAYALWSYVLSRIPATKAAGALYTMPIITTMMGWLVLGELPPWLSLAGGIVALIGAVLVSLQKQQVKVVKNNVLAKNPL